MSNKEPGWRNWGDHPLIVIVGLFAGIAAILTFVLDFSPLPVRLEVRNAPIASTTAVATPQPNGSPKDPESSRQSTPEPVPTPFVEGQAVTYAEEFDGTPYGFRPYQAVEIAEGNAIISPGGGMTYRTPITPGTSVAFLLKFEAGEFHYYLANKPTYWDKFVGLKTNSGYDLITSVSDAEKQTFLGGERFDGDLTFVPNRWYVAVIEWPGDDRFYLRVWEKDDPAVYSEKGLRLGPAWADEEWYPHVNVSSGSVTIEAFQEME